MSKPPIVKSSRMDGPRELTPAEDKIISGAPNMPAPAAPTAAPAAPPKEQEPVTKFLIEIPTRVHKALKVSCALEDTKMKDVVTMLLEDYIKSKQQ